MKTLKEKDEKKDNYLVPWIILVAVIIVGIGGLVLLQKYSRNNKYICSYLGGLWMRKDTDQAHRCYTYEEFYKYD